MLGQTDCTTSTFTASDSPNDLKVGFKLSENWKREAYMSYMCTLQSEGDGVLQTGFDWTDCVSALLQVCVCVCV